MMKIFISYARINKPVCIQLVHTLNVHEVWYDQRLYAGQHWWKEILRRLEWCDIFIYLLSKDSINSKYCRKELEIARQLGREIIPILIDPSINLPADLQEYQYVDMSKRLDAENITLLYNSILLIERNYALNSAPDKSRVKTSPKSQTAPLALSPSIIYDAAKSYDEGRYDDAIFLLEQAKGRGFDAKHINLDKLLKAAKKALDEQTKKELAAREYSYIVSLFQFKSTRPFACEALEAFLSDYPLHDPENLAQQCRNSSHEGDQEPLDIPILPMLEWCDIPGGIVRVANTGMHLGALNDESVIHLNAFRISKYPITNDQFQVFVNAEDGYSNLQWWRFSDYATAWFEEHLKPLNSRYAGANRPRENVSWYEAMAFTQWLSHKSGRNITLPSIAHWQRAAQGDDDRFYPWGNVFHEDRCNTHESRIKTTTTVDHYKDGVSPYGVFDMSGNVWEWTLDAADPAEGSFDHQRAVIGGSFVSPADRAQISFRYYLKPEVRYSSIGIRLIELSSKDSIDY
ncbi:MAG: SUMF1/EgtB/PvdO family nonheme iron enzyme [Anaerolineae bacterium]